MTPWSLLRRGKRGPRTGPARTRWRRLRDDWRWRAGLIRGEWWIGVRYDFPAEAYIIGLFGLVIVLTRH